jgi:hypothetical protein
VQRGFAISFVYFSALALSVYLLAIRLLPAAQVPAAPVKIYETVKTAIFFLSIAFLIVLMGWLGTGALRAALYTAGFMFSFLLLAFLCFKYAMKDPLVAGESLLRNFRTAIETHGEMTSYLVLLLATLGIMIGLFTVTGFINRMGGMLLQLGEWHIVALIFMAWVFAWLVGAGLPPTATYIILAVITVDPMRKLGIDPWVAHFFAFLMAIFGELSPPTSLTAAVAARIANASFMRTMLEALKLCLPITLMTFAIFTRPAMVVATGWAQVADTAAGGDLHLGSHLRHFRAAGASRGASFMLRMALALAALVVMFHPDTRVAWAVAAIVLPASIIGVVRHKRIAPPPPARPRARHGGGVAAIGLVGVRGGEARHDQGAGQADHSADRLALTREAPLRLVGADRGPAAGEAHEVVELAGHQPRNGIAALLVAAVEHHVRACLDADPARVRVHEAADVVDDHQRRAARQQQLCGDHVLGTRQQHGARHRAAVAAALDHQRRRRAAHLQVEHRRVANVLAAAAGNTTAHSFDRAPLTVHRLDADRLRRAAGHCGAAAREDGDQGQQGNAQRQTSHRAGRERDGPKVGAAVRRRFRQTD